MALTVTTANTNNLRGGARNVMRSPSGIPYVVVVDATDGGIEVWKGNGVSPTVFTEQNAASNPQTSGYGCVSAAMDSSGVIHIAYMYYNSKVSQLRYVTFSTATDTFSGDVAVKADIGNDPTSLLTLYTAIAVDGNDVPHVAYSEYPNKGGLPSLFYNNRIGGAWNSAGLEVEGATNGYPCAGYDLAIDLDNRPVVSYVRMVLRDFEYNAVAAIGNTNDPTGWTLKDLVFQSATGRTSIVVDPAGNHYVLCGELSYPRIYRHNRADAWTTWTLIYSGSSIEGRSLAWSGTTLYFLYESSAGNVCYQTFDGSVWSGETVLETGSFTFVKGKWGFWTDYDSAGDLITSGRVVAQNLTGATGMQLSSSSYKVGQSFAPSGQKLTSISLFLGRTGTVTGSGTISIYAHSGVYGTSSVPAGSPLATSGPVQASAIPVGGGYCEFVFTGANQISLDDPNYVFVLSHDFSYLNGTNWIYAQRSAGSEYSGNSCWYYSEQWNLSEGDLKFVVNSGYFRRGAAQIDYVFVDNTASPDIWWGNLPLTVAGWAAKPLKVYLGGSWVAKPLKYHNGSAWVEKPLKCFS